MSPALNAMEPGRHDRASDVKHLQIARNDNATVDLDSAELPILDGSAPFVFLFSLRVLRSRLSLRKFIRVKRPVGTRRDSPGISGRVLNPMTVFVSPFLSSLIIPPSTVLGGSDGLILPSINASGKCRVRALSGFMRRSVAEENSLAQGGGLDNAVVLDGYAY